MRREKFIYNTQTLRYEKVIEPLSVTLLRIFGFACAALFSAFLLTLLAHRYFPSPKEKAYQLEITELRSHNEEMVGEMEAAESVLQNIQKRDAFAYRSIFGVDPIDEGVWEGGKGGHDEYQELRQYGESGEMMIAMRQKLDKLKHKLNLQSLSLDSITSMTRDKEKMLASIPSLKPVRSDQLNRGLDLLSGFGMRMHPIHKIPKMHYGIDFSARSGTHIQATGAGKVIRAGYGSGYGNVVEIDHGYGYVSRYGHMQRIDVKVGQKVIRGEKIGLVGSTGHSTAPHCHYEVEVNGQKVDPIQFVTDGLSPAQYKELVRQAESAGQSFD